MYIGLTKSGQRLVLRKPLHLWWKRGICHRHLSSSPATQNWRNETPPGGLTEIFVYKPESQIVWPDSSLGIFAQGDPKFALPGNVGVLVDENDALSIIKENTQTTNHDATSSSENSANSRPKIDVLEEKTSKEHQAQTLYSAHDYIQYTQGSESYVCSNPVLLETFPSAFADMAPCRFELHDAPQLLKKELVGLFPGVTAFSNAGNSVSVITMARETQNDMSTWSDQVEDERELVTHQFVNMAKEVCTRLKYDGYWADFIDPTAGIPFYTSNTNGTMFETDEKYRLLGFRIEDLGCCKVICHRDFGRNVFVGSIFTSVPIHTGVIQDVFDELQMKNSLAVFQSDKTEEKFPSDLFA